MYLARNILADMQLRAVCNGRDKYLLRVIFGLLALLGVLKIGLRVFVQAGSVPGP